MNARELTDRLDGKMRGLSGWALCPAHKDKNPSLKIDDAADGKVLLKCFARCSQDAIIDALKKRGLWETNGQGKHEVARYEYAAVTGEKLIKVRYEPKSFAWFHDGIDPKTGKPGLISGCNGLKRRIYRYHEIEAAGDSPVFIVESEKSANILSKLGLHAVSPGGAENWMSYFASEFNGAKNIIVLPDNNDPGRKMAAAVIKSLPKAKVIELDGLPEAQGPDHWPLLLSDPQAAVQELLRLADTYGHRDVTTDHVATDAEIVKSWDWTSSEALKALDLPPLVPWLDPIAFAGSGSIVHGATGAGKTMWGLGLSLALVSGTGFGPYTATSTVPPLRVLYLDYELGQRLMRDRLPPFVHPRLHIICRDSPELGDDGLLPIDTDEGQEQVRKFVEAIKPDVIFIDNLFYAVAGDFFSGSDKNSAVPKLKFLKKLGPAYFIFNHLGHDQSHGYGDRRTAWGMDSELLMEAGDDGRTGYLTVRITEKKMRVRRGALLKPYSMSFDGCQWAMNGAPGGEVAKLSERQSWLVAAAIRLLESGKAFMVPERTYPVAYVSDLREMYRKQYFAADPHGSSERQAWKRDVEACVTYFTVGDPYLWRARRDA